MAAKVQSSMRSLSFTISTRLRFYTYLCGLNDENRMQAVDLTRGNLRRHLIRIALPIMGTGFMQMAYSFTDMAWLGRLGSQAVAAVGAVSVLGWIANSIAQINKTGSEITISQSLGAGREDKARSYASHNVTMALVISLALGLVFALFSRQLIGFYRLDTETNRLAVEYLYIVLPGLPTVFLAIAFSGIYNAAGHSAIPFRITGIGLLMNIILDPLFIFTFGLGTAGAGLATLLSQTVVCLLFLRQLRHDRLFSHFPLFARLKRHQSLRILKIGLPVAMFSTLFAFINMYMGRLASLAALRSGLPLHIGVSTLTTGGQLEAITWNTSQGFATALSTVSGQNYAAGKEKRLFAAFRHTLVFTSAFGLIGTVLFLCKGQSVFALIVPDPVAFIAGGTYLQISGYSQLFMMCEITCQGLFYGTSRTVPPAVISIAGNCLRIPASYLVLAYGGGLVGLWWVITCSSILKGLVALLWLYGIRNRIRRSAHLRRYEGRPEGVETNAVL